MDTTTPPREEEASPLTPTSTRLWIKGWCAQGAGAGETAVTLHRAALQATRPKGVSQGLDTGGDRRPSLSKGRQHSSSPSVMEKQLVLSRLTGCLLHIFFFSDSQGDKGFN